MCAQTNILCPIEDQILEGDDSPHLSQVRSVLRAVVLCSVQGASLKKKKGEKKERQILDKLSEEPQQHCYVICPFFLSPLALVGLKKLLKS